MQGRSNKGKEGNGMDTVRENDLQAAEYFKRLAGRKERRWCRVRNALLIWSFVASAISIVLSLIRLAR